MSDSSEFRAEVIDQVRRWLDSPASHSTRESRAERRLAALVHDERGIEFTIAFVDRVVRPESLTVAAESLRSLSRDLPGFLSPLQRLALRAGGVLAPVVPWPVIPIARAVVRRMVGHLVVDARPRRLTRSLNRLRKEDVSLNMNLLGEAVLGEKEATRRRDATIALVSRPDVDYVSVKVSGVASQINLWAFDETVERILDRLRPVYRAAVDKSPAAFINLDMEEYRDLRLTVAVFFRLLAEFPTLEAGIVLQAYLPDALPTMRQIQAAAAERVASGGAPIKVRLVKGANLPMERVDAAIHGWPLATFAQKTDTDAHYKRVLDWAMTPDRVRNVRLGVAGHNLFDIAHAWLLADRRGVRDRVEFEMLLGMATAQAEAVRQDVGGLLLYVPVVHPDDFDAAIAYLVRRLDENASGDNFMSAMSTIARDEDVFSRERDRYLAAMDRLQGEPPSTHRSQDRSRRFEPRHGAFMNAPDTDPSTAANQEWARRLHARVAESTLGVGTTRVDSEEELDRLLGDARSGGERWRTTSTAQRAAILRACADGIERQRAALCEVMASECGKVLDEADPEVSEAADFARYYAERAEDLDRVTGASFVPRTVTLAAPPWNFPVAICAGSVLAALAAGSAVVLKPAPQARRCAAVLTEIMHGAGVPPDALLLVDVGEDELGRQLVTHTHVDQVILTGAWQTAELFTSWSSNLRLNAETSGKNAIVVTPHADLDLAAADLARSAFGHAGQKCSAASLGILVGPVAGSARFRRQLVDAVTSMKVGDPADPESVIGPVIEPPTDKLRWALTTLEPGESWLVEPRQIGDRLWTPGIRTGVRPGSRFHQEEFFGPVLGLMEARDLDEALAIQNGTPFGLTAGLHSLEKAEIDRWLPNVEAGNLYVNRGITGAIVRRQSFGGWKRSVVGSGFKSGGPNYVLQLGDWRSAHVTPPGANLPLLPRIDALLGAVAHQVPEAVGVGLRDAAQLDERAWAEEFGRPRDDSGLGVELNVLRYRPAPNVHIRAGDEAHLADTARVVIAGLRAGATIQLSASREATRVLGDFVSTAMVEGAPEFARRIDDGRGGRVRVIGAAESRAQRDLLGSRPEWSLFAGPVTQAGRIEMLTFLREQSVSITAHRFGNLVSYRPDFSA